MKIYLIHLKTLNDRRRNVLDLLCECSTIDNIEIIMAESSDLKFATLEEIAATLPQDFPIKLPSQGASSLYHKHYLAFKKIANNNEPAIILEDDVLFQPIQLDEFISGYDQAPSDCECCFFGSGWAETISRRTKEIDLEGNGFILNTNRLKSKCTDSMVVHPQFAQSMCNIWASDKAYTAIDWDLNYHFINLNTKVYWYQPGVTFQGSMTGAYKSLC